MTSRSVTSASLRWPGPSALAPLDLVDERGEHGMGVPYHAEVRETEHRGLRVLVDGDDRARAAHAGSVLDRPRDAAGQVQLGRDGLAGLTDLEVVVVPAEVGGD